MAVFQILVQAQPEEPYENIPGLAFFNMFRGEYDSWMNDPQFILRKINPEVLTRDIILNNGSIALNGINVEDNTNVVKITPATIKDINELSNVIFFIKDVFFEGDTTQISNLNQLPADILEIGSSPSNLSNLVLNTLGNTPYTDYDISDLHNLYVSGEDLNTTIAPDLVRGYIDIYYTFRKSNSTYDVNINNMSILRIQFGYSKGHNPSAALNIPFTIIRNIPESEFDSVMLNIGNYELELNKGTDKNGDLMPIYYHSLNGPTDTGGLGGGLELPAAVHSSGYIGDIENFTIGRSSTSTLNGSIASTSSITVNGIIAPSYNQLKDYDIIKQTGIPTGTVAGGPTHDTQYIVTVIPDNDYEPLD